MSIRLPLELSVRGEGTSGLRHLLQFWRRGGHGARIDPRTLGDHISRDIGLIDGRGPQGSRGEFPDWI